MGWNKKQSCGSCQGHPACFLLQLSLIVTNDLPSAWYQFLISSSCLSNHIGDPCGPWNLFSGELSNTYFNLYKFCLWKSPFELFFSFLSIFDLDCFESG